MLEKVHEVELGSRGKLGEVDDDVVALGNGVNGHDAALGTEGTVKGDGVFHHVAVVGDHVEGNTGAILVDQGHLDVAGNRAIKDAESVLSGSHVEVRLVLPVREQFIAHESVRVEWVEPQLPFLIPGLVGDDQVDVVVPVTPVQ